MLCRAFLFDLDGTLIDSMPLHAQSWRLWHAEQGLAYDEAGFFEATAGRTNTEIMASRFPRRSAAEHARLAERKEELYRALAVRALGPIAGVDAFLAASRAAGLKLAICTAAPADNRALAFERFGLAPRVDTVTSPDDGLRGKPEPDIFVEAARRLGIAARDCVVFEDAPLGVEAARRAGMRAVAITSSLPAAAFADFPNLIAAAADFTSLRVGAIVTQPEQVAHDA